MGYGWVDEVAERAEGMTRVRELRSAESRGRLAALREVREMVNCRHEGYRGHGGMAEYVQESGEILRDIDALIAKEEGR